MNRSVKAEPDLSVVSASARQPIVNGKEERSWWNCAILSAQSEPEETEFHIWAEDGANASGNNLPLFAVPFHARHPTCCNTKQNALHGHLWRDTHFKQTEIMCILGLGIRDKRPEHTANINTGLPIAWLRNSTGAQWSQQAHARQREPKASMLATIQGEVIHHRCFSEPTCRQCTSN
jgi:hypothetical protein